MNPCHYRTYETNIEYFPLERLLRFHNVHKVAHKCDELIKKVMLKPSTEGLATAEEISSRFRSVGSELTAGVLERVRKFITLSRHMQFSVTDEVQAAVERDFVASRQQQQGRNSVLS